MDIKFKLCGLNSETAVELALEAGADWMGFIVFPASPRHVSAERAGALARFAAGGAESVAVVVDPDDALLGALKREAAPDWIQLHGRESPERVGEVRAYAKRGVIKSIPVAEAGDLEAARAYKGVADMLLFDAKPPENATRPGGLGIGYDYSLLKKLDIETPWLLSGGLSPANLREAVARSGARAVDVSSGVESAPGVKDKKRIEAFVEKLNAADRDRDQAQTER